MDWNKENGIARMDDFGDRKMYADVAVYAWFRTSFSQGLVSCSCCPDALSYVSANLGALAMASRSPCLEYFCGCAFACFGSCMLDRLSM
jgi:hypothetical protein